MMVPLIPLAATALPPEADGASVSLVRDLFGFCDRIVQDPASAIIASNDTQTYYAEVVGSTIVTNSATFEDDVTGLGKRHQHFRRSSLTGGVMVSCTVSHAYWEGEHPYHDLLDVMDGAASAVSKSPVHRRGGQLSNVLLRSERFVWSEATFPPELWLEATIQTDSVSLSANRAVHDA